MNKQQLQQEIADLQKQLEEKQKALSAMPEKWKPKGGEWFVDLFGETSTTSMMARELSEFGVSFATREQAEKAAKAMRAHNRLLAYVAEFAPGYESSGIEGKHHAFVFFNKETESYDLDWHDRKVLGAVYMTLRVARELVAKLNSGEVEL